MLLLSFISRILIVNEHGRRANFGLGEALATFRVVMKMFRDGTWKTSLNPVLMNESVLCGIDDY